MTRYQNILSLVVKTLLVLLIAVMVGFLCYSIFKGVDAFQQATGAGLSIGSIVILMDRFYRYLNLSRELRSVNDNPTTTD
jgi:hypothetical protein